MSDEQTTAEAGAADISHRLANAAYFDGKIAGLLTAIAIMEREIVAAEQQRDAISCAKPLADGNG